MNRTRRLIAASALLACAATASAQTTVREAWVRGTVAQQRATGAFMQLQSAQGGRLVSASSPAAGVVEVHEMVMDGSTMRMRALAGGLDLPAGKTVELRPGGYHVMLMDLKAPLKAGEQVELNLVVEGRDGRRETLAVKAPVRALGAAAEGHRH